MRKDIFAKQNPETKKKNICIGVWGLPFRGVGLRQAQYVMLLGICFAAQSQDRDL